MGVLILFVLINLVNLKATKGFQLPIVGGTYSKIEDFPHSVFLFIECDTWEGIHHFKCGASIVNQAILLTAAHCIYDCHPITSVIEAHVGHVNIFKGSLHAVSKFKMHNKYNEETVANDVALVKLRQKLKFGKNVRRIVLMRKPPYYDGLAQVAGWGMTQHDIGGGSFMLKHVVQKVWYKIECRRAGLKLPRGTLCGGYDENNHPARGDSGSAMVVKKLIQIGLVSYFEPKVGRHLVVYTDTGYFFRWIRKEAKKLYCSSEP